MSGLSRRSLGSKQPYVMCAALDPHWLAHWVCMTVWLAKVGAFNTGLCGLV